MIFCIFIVKTRCTKCRLLLGHMVYVGLTNVLIMFNTIYNIVNIIIRFWFNYYFHQQAKHSKLIDNSFISCFFKFQSFPQVRGFSLYSATNRNGERGKKLSGMRFNCGFQQLVANVVAKWTD